MKRRDLLRQLGGGATALAFASNLRAQGGLAGQTAAKPFRVAIPAAKVDRILRQVREYHWPEPMGGTAGWQYGANYQYMRDLAAYWTSRFDWKKTEQRLNAHPQFLARVQDAQAGEFDIHFYHVRAKASGEVRPMPVILTHGWPGSVVEFQEAIDLLTDPAAHGGSAEEALDVVIPSLPGFGFSSKPRGKPIGPVTTARLWHSLMTQVLGYSRFGAQGGDWGNAVTMQLGLQFPQALTGIHFNAGGVRGVPEAQQSDEEKAWSRAAAVYRQNELDYFNEQTHKPQTVGFALNDNPVGFAAWVVEKLKSWSDSGDDLDATLSKDQVLANIMWYLVSDTAGSGVWYYRGNADDASGPRRKIEVPTGFAAFPKEMTALAPPRSMLERDFNLIRYTKMPRGGHFACFEQPQFFAEDVRAFFRQVRTA
jgi:microsomal epoxide hydrolase